MLSDLDLSMPTMTICAAFLAVMVAITSVQGNPIQTEDDTPIPQRLARDVSGGNFLRFGKRFGLEDDSSMRFRVTRCGDL